MGPSPLGVPLKATVFNHHTPVLPHQVLLLLPVFLLLVLVLVLLLLISCDAALLPAS